ncbi:U6 snRNA-associated Sm-like protein LSm1 [Nematocida sp. AWRm77]|nr:U6 snRNA-associated Sm-like protein LSm1 [Nematocida sp. AWRm77]
MKAQIECGVRMLEEYLDKEVFVLTRDNVFTHGTLRTFDQYHNVLLETVVEISVAENEYSEQKSEIIMLRGENIVFLGKSTKPLYIPLKKTSRANIIEKSKHQIPEDLDYITL